MLEDAHHTVLVIPASDVSIIASAKVEPESRRTNLDPGYFCRAKNSGMTNRGLCKISTSYNGKYDADNSVNSLAKCLLEDAHHVHNYS